MRRALWSRIKIQQHEQPHLTRSALLERITAVPVRPEPDVDGWWRLGVIFDDLEGQEYNVWYRPRGLAMSPRQQPEMRDPGIPKLVPADEAYTFRGYRAGGGGE